MAKNNYVRLVDTKEKEKEKTSFQVFKDFVEKQISYKLEFWVMLANWMNNLSVQDKKALKKEIEEKGFKNNNDVWTFLGY